MPAGASPRPTRIWKASTPTGNTIKPNREHNITLYSLFSYSYQNSSSAKTDRRNAHGHATSQSLSCPRLP